MSLSSTQRVQKVFELIRTKASDQYRDYVPALADKDPIGNVSAPILNNPLVFKEFTVLLGAFMEQRVWKQAWQNPLADMIRKTGSPLGEYSADIATNPVIPRQYAPNHPERVLQYAMTNDYVAYYVRNVKELFKISIAYSDMQGAFQSYDKFDEYVQGKLSSLESGYQLSNFNHIMEAIVTNYNSGLFVESSFHIPSNPTQDDYSKFTSEVKSLVKHFKFPSSKYNNYGSLENSQGEFKGYSKPEDIYVIGTIDWLTEVNVNYLASIFNLDKAEIENRIIEVPEFAYYYWDEDDNGNPTTEHKVTCPIECMVVDQRAFNFKQDLDLDDTFYNKETMVTNYLKHFWAQFSISPFANCVVFINTEGITTPIDIYVKDYGQEDGERFIDIKTAGAEQIVEFDTVPSIATTQGTALGNVTFRVTDIIDNFNTPIDVSTLNDTISTYLTLPTTNEIGDYNGTKYKFVGVNNNSIDSATIVMLATFADYPTTTVPIIAVIYKQS